MSARPDTGHLHLSQTKDLQTGAAESTQVAEVTYLPVPPGDADPATAWRLRFDGLGDQYMAFGLDVLGEAVLGRGSEGDVVDLSDFDAEMLGVSRRHLMLRPTPSQFFVLDMGSTNGTLLNDRHIGTNIPYSISSGDVLSLGGLRLVVNIVDRPRTETGILREQANLGDALREMVKGIASQLELDEVIGQAVEAALTLTGAAETVVWLVDEETSQLILEAERSAQDAEVRRTGLPVTDALAGKVVATGKPVRVSRDSDGQMVETGDANAVETTVYMPITLGGVAIGVLAAAQHDGTGQFAERDLRILQTVADFAAIAVANSRVYEAADRALARRVQELSALNELSQAVSSSLDPRQVYTVLTRQVQLHWQVEAVSLWMVDRDSQTSSLVSDSRHKEGERSKRALKLTQTIVDRVVGSGESVLLSDLSREARGQFKIFDTLEMKSELAVPIKLQNEVLGVLDLQSPRLNRFSETDIHTLQTVVDQLAVAIQNAHLHKQVQGYAEQLEHMVGHRTEDLHSANDNLQALSRLKDEFVANVSHELRTPITNLRLLHNVLKTAPSEKRQGFLDAMERETQRLEGIVSDMLRLSHMDQGHVTLDLSAIHLNELASRYVEDRMTVAENRGLIITLDGHPEEPIVTADEGLLGQALSILLTNALNYTPSGGTVEVRTHVRKGESGAWGGFSVSDTGPGIPPDEQPFLFERFFRGKAARESSASGTGLGLAIAKEIVDLHDGRIELRSEGIVGRGCTFSVWIPLEEMRAANLLLVDDDETMLNVLEEILSGSGYNVQAARTGADALSLLQEGDLPDLVITDVVMPGMTGLQLLETVRANPDWATLPFVFISASTTLAMEGQIAGLDNVIYLRKPFDSDALKRTITNMMRGRLR